MRLHLYIARRFLRAFFSMLIVLAMIFVLLDMVEGMRRFDAASVGFMNVLGLTLLNAPVWMYRILPLIVILSTVWMFLSLSRSSEMVVTRAAGRSALMTLISPVLTVLLFGILAVAIGNPIAAGTTKKYERISAQYEGRGASVLSIASDGVWLRQGIASGQTVIRADRANLEGTELFEVTFFSFSPEGPPTLRIEADSAKLEPGYWAIRGAKVWDLISEKNPEMTAIEYPMFTLASNLTLEQILDSFGKPSTIPIWDLPAFIRQLEAAGFSARSHRVWLHMELAMPVFLVAMVLIGAGFTMRHTRFGRTGVMVLYALMMGFGIYFIRNFAQILGENGQIPIILAAWAPPIAAILLPLGILLHLEDG
ncbi:lipopolysaccharide export system permease protein [Aliiroseovarius halocynthiae]|uniref:LPS export ABC transporter permease LptG n=1 Tax=Aliiroseovarius halocynthiae TaxID=985055 RepID=A0A545SVK0_9RHOB|nr:LPS export ABC transporter permease LptG [Aliiroseovarius halocynthiae]TQV68984.1 LPS export ABC transporter permease LptG [Aliiroseovarius halocynthiae]SMR71726.1 lipopolysaccharide export system permease protein [Aliiroseovarius halocynthiae]